MQSVKEARDLLAKHGVWTQSRNARDKDGNSVSVHSPEAVCFCLQGALLRCKVTYEELCDIQSFCVRTREKSFTVFNDTQASVEPVLQLLDEYLNAKLS